MVATVLQTYSSSSTSDVRVATAVILTTDKAAGVHITKVAGDTVDKVVEEFKDLVSKNKE